MLKYVIPWLEKTNTTAKKILENKVFKIQGPKQAGLSSTEKLLQDAGPAEAHSNLHHFPAVRSWAPTARLCSHQRWLLLIARVPSLPLLYLLCAFHTSGLMCYFRFVICSSLVQTSGWRLLQLFRLRCSSQSWSHLQWLGGTLFFVHTFIYIYK